MTTEDSGLPFDTRDMTATEALVEVDELCWAGPAEKGAALFRALHAQEKEHPKKPRKTVLDALEERIGEFEVAALQPSQPEGVAGAINDHAEVADPDEGQAIAALGTEVEDEDEPEVEDAGNGEEMVSEGAPEAGGEPDVDVAEDEGKSEVEEESVDEDGEGDPEGSGEPEEAEEAGPVPPEPGATVLVTDDKGTVHEGVIVRAVEQDEIPLIVSVKDGTDSQVRLVHDPDGREPSTWRAP